MRIKPRRRDDSLFGKLRHFELRDVEQLDVFEGPRGVEQRENASLPFAIRVLGHPSQRRHALDEIALDGRERLTAADKDGARMFDFGACLGQFSIRRARLGIDLRRRFSDRAAVLVGLEFRDRRSSLSRAKVEGW